MFHRLRNWLAIALFGGLLWFLQPQFDAFLAKHGLDQFLNQIVENQAWRLAMTEYIPSGFWSGALTVFLIWGGLEAKVVIGQVTAFKQKTSLSLEEKRTLTAEMVKLRPQLPRLMMALYNVNGIHTFYNSIKDAVERAGIPTVQRLHIPVGPEETGVMIAVKDVTNVPALAQDLQTALRKIGLEGTIIASLPGMEDPVSLFVGPFPLD